MARQPKFRRGETVTIGEAVALIERGRWLYWLDRPKHPGVLMSMQLATLMWACRKGIVRLAHPNEAEP